MTCGIYQLVFSDGSRYVGQSVDIENRWKQHTEKFISGKAAKPMQDAFHRCGHPQKYIMLECHKDHLDMMESMFIHSGLKDHPNGEILNTSIPKAYTAAETWEVTRDDTYLKLSIVQLIYKLKTAYKNIDVLEEEIDTLKDEGIIIPKEIRLIKEKNVQLSESVDQLIKINQELSRRANMSWFERLFS